MADSPRKLIKQLIQHVQSQGGAQYTDKRSVPTDGQWVAIGLLALAESLDSVSTSLDNIASSGSDEVAKALGEGLGDIERALTGLTAALPDR